MDHPETFYTPGEAARILRVSERTVKEHLRTGRLRGIKVGKLWRIPASALAAPERPPLRMVEPEPSEAAEVDEFDDLSPHPCHMTLLGLVESLVEQLEHRQPILAR